MANVRGELFSSCTPARLPLLIVDKDTRITNAAFVNDITLFAIQLELLLAQNQSRRHPKVSMQNQCGFNNETIAHFLLYCPMYRAQRRVLHNYIT
jgi:hypothetical protein